MQPLPPLKPKPYAALRGLMIAHDVSQQYLAIKIRRSLSYVESRLNARAPWSQDDMYKIIQLFHLEPSQLHIYFPPNGITQPTPAERKPRVTEKDVKEYIAQLLAANS